MNSRLTGKFLDFLVFRLAHARNQGHPQTDRLNIGSAYVVASGWINLDNSPSVWFAKHNTVRYLLQNVGILQESSQKRWPSEIVFHDVRHGLPWPDRTFQYIYTSHLLEHLTHEDGEQLLRECYRVMKPGAILRVVVPNLFLYAKKYVKSFTDIDEDCGIVVTELAREELLEIVGLYPGTISTRNPHRWMYDQYSLTKSLSKTGFVEIEEQADRRGRIPDLKILEAHHDYSLYLEATRA